MDISVVIVNYKSAGLVRECIKSFRSSAHNLSYEIIVADNSPQGKLGDLLATRYPDVRYVAIPKNGGMGAGNNAGIKHAQGRYVLICNPDITASDGFLDGLVNYLEAHPHVGIAAPRLYAGNGDIQQSYYRYFAPLTPAFRRTPLGKTPWGKKHIAYIDMHDVTIDGPTPVEWAQGSCLCVRKEEFDALGGFDEQFFMYFEDSDLCRRYWNIGKEVHYLPDVGAVHLHMHESRGNWVWGIFTNALTRSHIMSAIRFFYKYPPQSLYGVPATSHSS